MGNYRFRLSDMIPNSWLQKLRDMNGRTKSSRAHHHHHQLPPPIKKKQPPSSSSATPPHSCGSKSNPLPNPLPDPPHPRKSYHFARELTPPHPHPHPHFPSPPRKSAKQRRPPRRARRSSPRLVGSSVSAGCSCRATATLGSFWTKPEPVPECSTSPPSDASTASDSEELLQVSNALPQLSPESCGGGVVAHRSFDQMVSWSSSSCRCRVPDPDESTDRKQVKSPDGCESVSTEVELPPILTKPANFSDMVKNLKNRETPEPTEGRTTSQLSVRVVKAERITMQEHSKARRSFSVSSPGMKLRINSPRLASTKRAQSQGTHHHNRPGRKSASLPSPSNRRRRSVSDSFAVMKSSVDPQSDFRDSMMEMIVENDIRASKDLEELLACYLSLNSDEYHDLIIKVFKQIWFDLNCNRLK